jgi:hypothetical protein
MFEGLTRLYAQGQPSLGIFSDEGGQQTPPRVARVARPPVSEAEKQLPTLPNGLPPDAAALLDFLRREGPHTYGAAARELGIGATRAWQAEARLRAAGLVRYNDQGRTCAAKEGGAS